MQKQILSLAIALPTILFTALPTLANPIQRITPKVGNLQPALVQLGSQTPVSNQLTSARNNEAPGPDGGVKPLTGPGPKPGRRDKDSLSEIRGTGGLQNPLNISPVNLNINQGGLGH